MNREKESEVEEDFSDCFSFEPEVTKPKPTGIYYDLESQSFTTRNPCGEIMIVDDVEPINVGKSQTDAAKAIRDFVKSASLYKHYGGTVTGRIKSNRAPEMQQMPRTVKDSITGIETYTPQIQMKYKELVFEQGHRVALFRILRDLENGLPYALWSGVPLYRRDIEKIIGSLEIAKAFTYRVPLQD